MVVAVSRFFHVCMNAKTTVASSTDLPVAGWRFDGIVLTRTSFFCFRKRCIKRVARHRFVLFEPKLFPVKNRASLNRKSRDCSSSAYSLYCSVDAKRWYWLMMAATYLSAIYRAKRRRGYPWHFLYFFPLPHQQGVFRPNFN